MSLKYAGSIRRDQLIGAYLQTVLHTLIINNAQKEYYCSRRIRRWRRCLKELREIIAGLLEGICFYCTSYTLIYQELSAGDLKQRNFITRDTSI